MNNDLLKQALDALKFYSAPEVYRPDAIGRTTDIRFVAQNAIKAIEAAQAQPWPHSNPWAEAIDQAMVSMALDCTAETSDPKECVELLVNHCLDLGKMEAQPVGVPAGMKLVPSEATYVECRECGECGHVGINDSSATQATCGYCDWSGDSPAEDECPQCKEKGSMGSACPKCGGRYYFLAEKELAAAPSLPVDEKVQNFDHLAGRGMHELRFEELGPYVRLVTLRTGIYSNASVEALNWIVSELERKTNDERVLARQLADMREALAAQGDKP